MTTPDRLLKVGVSTMGEPKLERSFEAVEFREANAVPRDLNRVPWRLLVAFAAVLGTLMGTGLTWLLVWMPSPKVVP